MPDTPAPYDLPINSRYVAEYLCSTSIEQLNRCIRGNYAGAQLAGRERLRRLGKQPLPDFWQLLDTPTNKPGN